MPGYESRWVRAHPANVVVVPMNAVRVVSLHEMFAIGTEALPFAILAHIPPPPTASASDPYAGDNNVRRLMAELTALYMLAWGRVCGLMIYPETTPTRDKELCSLSVSAGSPPLDSPMIVALVFTSRTSNMFRGRRPDMFISSPDSRKRLTVRVRRRPAPAAVCKESVGRGEAKYIHLLSWRMHRNCNTNTQ
ncbi:hypothetical protein ASPFODRAFT_63735 [Aspergillus luchuensis CBS 106.47]|uniref:Uncharacterized protein n=1 Tax=Aspergillus luchuensis (strain CBS 106.47) TaxID=1137211 RepID=A0A1M3T716_ASPLC|nr:hypothetical protein ASPFODRAFT_63735 [Aspergillus luchuensis CBS 106.47]